MKKLQMVEISAGQFVEVEVSTPTEVGRPSPAASETTEKGGTATIGRTGTGGGTVEIGITDVASRAFTQAMEKVRGIANSVVAQLRDAAPNEIEVTFGVKIGGKTGLIIAEGSSEANLQVKLKFACAKETTPEVVAH
jgi:hypothetical protein